MSTMMMETADSDCGLDTWGLNKDELMATSMIKTDHSWGSLATKKEELMLPFPDSDWIAWIEKEKVKEEEEMKQTGYVSHCWQSVHIICDPTFSLSPSLLKDERLFICPDSDSDSDFFYHTPLSKRPKLDVPTIPTDGLVSFLQRHFFLCSVRERCTHTVQAAATLVLRLYTKEYFYKKAYQFELGIHLNTIWEEVGGLREKDCTLEALYELIIRQTAGSNLVTEPDLFEVVDTLYDELRYKRSFPAPCQYLVGDLPQKDSLFLEIKRVVMEMDNFAATLTEDDYPRLVISLLRDEHNLAKAVVENVFTSVMRKLKPPGSEEDEHIKLELEDLLWELVGVFKVRMRQELVDVVLPFERLCYGKEIACEVMRVVEVAELRRRAQGKRFIGQSHLMWAFKKCGYGLPPTMKDVSSSHSDLNHPPYHIYVAAKTFAEKDKFLTMEHFIFAVFHSKDIGFDREKMIQMREGPFAHFLKVLKDDPKSAPNS